MEGQLDRIYSDNKQYSSLEKAIWLYVILLVFEGALRKWVLPGLSTPLLIVRDPVAIYIIFKAYQSGYFRFNIYTGIISTVAVLGVIFALVFGHGVLFVSIYGARVYLLHFPLIFIFGAVLDRSTVEKIGVFLVYTSIFMVVLIFLQFYSPQSAWVNRGVGGDLDGAGFGGAMGYYRPSGTFSFTNGAALFFSLVFCFVLYFWGNPGKINTVVLVLSTVSIVFAIPLSISRTLLFQVCLTLLFFIFSSLSNPKVLKTIFYSFISMIILIIILQFNDSFNLATEVFLARFDSANEYEGGLEGVFIDRFLGGLVSALSNLDHIPFFGFGIGMGSNVGSYLVSGGDIFLLGEEEWEKTIGELGVFLGLTTIFIRVVLSLDLGLASYKQISVGNLLPWLIFSNSFLIIMQGQWTQPTGLGFAVISAGLGYAAINSDSVYTEKLA
ncbi:hypothetical protein [Algoriphagus chordae]|uniref:O-antigen ligase-like membrane protein n=1 Tax=Algoriphagus chordae TaxID=237019 RepID=A0A2W7R1G4_9BACT|nr:hypothetical protein [Algoriphagus chordae]PZX52080.1 hypothetical protein LV85_02230 [Algoriphagus chordae]